jgi:hypothetical protein
MATYGDAAHVLKLIRSDPKHEVGEDVDARIDLLNPTVSAALEEACGRTWGAAVANTTELVWMDRNETTVFLPYPARAITAVRYGGTMVGTTMSGGTSLTASDIHYPLVDEDGLIYAFRSNEDRDWRGDWELGGKSPVAVTADFITTDDDTTVPDEIKWVASYCIAEMLKVEKASAFGAVGPDGDVLPLRDVFALPLVQRIIARHTVQKFSYVLAV